jgi:hypothetical protein
MSVEISVEREKNVSPTDSYALTQGMWLSLSLTDAEDEK